MATYVEDALQIQEAMAAIQKVVTIHIAPDDLTTLKTSDYKLCFAKKVGDHAFNVVWQSYDKYLKNNQFSWTPQFQVFGSNSFHSKLTVNVSTGLQKIGLGEECTMNSQGTLEPAKTGGPKTGFTFVNDYGHIHPGVNQLSIGVTGEQVSTPIYVAEEPAVKGNILLTPVEKVLVWFEQNIETSTMFSDARSRAVEIDLTLENSATRLYKDGDWSTP